MNKRATIEWALSAKKINGRILATRKIPAVWAFSAVSGESLDVVVKKRSVKIVVMCKFL
ncbi:hypothetical protein [Marinobacter shengliensis]|uniref:hypothetical protein n=1 Tax=Marinobacter shengliensis TaxID=1389223 RepID=UPI0025742245|nr:hypothetical protein [Marinobacter shengliensis]BEH14884.1 hypothetical protein MAALD49_22520 [Marinobacter shengliensis]